MIKAKPGDTLTFRFKARTGYLRMIAWSPTQKKAEYASDVFPENEWMEFKYPVTVSGYYNLYLGYTRGITSEVLLAYKLRVDPKRRN